MGTTLQKIADEANVSISTASRALNGHSAISAETVAKVQEVAERLQYQQRRSHRRMDARRCLSKANIGILSLGMDRSLIALPAVASAISGAEAALTEAGASVQLAQIPNLANVPRSLFRQSFDGVILTGAMQGDLLNGAETHLLDQLRATPTCWILGRPIGCWGDAVASDDYGTGSSVAEYLVSRGHSCLALLNPKPDHLLFMNREDGFVAAARRLNADVSSFCESPSGAWELPLQAPQTIETVADLVDRMIAAKPRPTAVFAVADSVAALVYRALTERGLRVGEDISVISGNNDAALIQSLYPHLTTFDIHAYDLGRLAVRQLALRMSYPGDYPDTETTLPPTLLEGASVAALG
jgi:LacI family transcriptional regulator, galactose operon repressor